MTFKPKHKDMLENERLRAWYDNHKARSILTADVYLRTLGLYCQLNDITPSQVVEQARDEQVRDNLMKFVRRLENEGKAGSYIARFQRSIKSWLKFNGLTVDFSIINIKDVRRSPTIENERVPEAEELSKIFEYATPRAKVSIALMSFAGVRPEVLGNFEGTDGLLVGDIKELEIFSDHVAIDSERIPAQIRVRGNLSKIRDKAPNGYFTFIGPQGMRYVIDYLNSRMSHGESINESSNLLSFDREYSNSSHHKHKFVRTLLITREIKQAILEAGFKWRPYVLRAYHSTALDRAENKGLISHNWREFFSGHTGDISARYSTNKNLPQEMVDEMRETYRNCLKFLETDTKGITEEDHAGILREHSIRTYAMFTGEELSKEDKDTLMAMEESDFWKEISERYRQNKKDMLNNGHSQKVVSVKEVKEYINKGWEYVNTLPGNREVIVKLPS